MLVGEQRCDRGNAQPVEEAEVEPQADGDEQCDGARMRKTRPPEELPLAEPRSERMETLFAVDLEVEERVKEVEARNPERNGAAQSPSRPRKSPRDGNPGADRREAVHRAEPSVREPGPTLQVGIDHECRHGDRPE